MKAERPIDGFGDPDPGSRGHLRELAPLRRSDDNRAPAHAGTIEAPIDPERLA
jgi:hypothetical protein